MPDVSFDNIVAAIARPTHTLTTSRRLHVAEEPNPFVPPTFSAADATVLASEVIFMEASAAVGKSTVAKHLSATLRVPLLDLSSVPVSTGTLTALLLDFGGDDPIRAFHEGRLPIIVDALDEGRLKSAETGFENFLITAAELIKEQRVVTNRPKIIFFGRHESTSLAKSWIELGGEGAVSIGLVDIGYFDEIGARKLIDAFVHMSSDRAQTTQHEGTAHDLITAYFNSIEAALGMSAGTLWTDERGRAFAGYAPVLAAIGALLSEIKNYISAANRLRDTGTEEAWSVIETVLYEILNREREKLIEKLAEQTPITLPAAAYDPVEQLTLLTQFLNNQELIGTNRVNLPPVDYSRYRDMIEQYIPEHPFIIKGQFGNSVLASLVMAHAIAGDLLRDTDLGEVAKVSRQPFLWRSLRQRVNEGTLIDGRYVGHILNSFWSDPLSPIQAIFVLSQMDDNISMFVPNSSSDSYRSINVVSPIILNGEVRNSYFDILEELKLDAHGGIASDTTFYFKGKNTVICGKLSTLVNNIRVAELTADGLKQDGELWLEAEEIDGPAQQNLNINGSKVGWGGIVGKRYPWSRHRPVLEPPYQVSRRGGSLLEKLVEEGARRLPVGVTVTVRLDYTPAPDDPQMRWASRQFSQEFAALIGLMIKHNWASSARMGASGEGRMRVRFSGSWGNLLAAIRNPDHDPSLRALVTEARQLIK